MDALSDNALMLKVKNGDVDKLGLLYSRYSKKLFGFFYRLTHRADVSEDLVQNVFYRILKYRHTYRGEGQFKTWIYHLARNVHVDQFKKNKRYHFSENHEFLEDKMEQLPATDEEVMKRQETALLESALNRLPEEKKEILILSRYQELKYEEIGRILNCSEGAVKVRIHRAIKDLKKMYQKMEKEGIYGN
ncbi:RNA polymerase sigma factor [Fulvivirgaceae bacterium BMA10]|uniref:RNA polymerase sigma factor n=1 Tax=Splendidivirga corallicola TaxID=3051826 RepID=A0ABT8KS11_9BACT|nr:RNA polymerase sigma factor [Fulvivirgaceae bacterium BMA10]